MAITTQSGVPSSITRGDAVSFSVSDPDHPAASWTSIVYFVIPGETPVAFSRDSISGSDHVWTLTNAETGTIPVGVGSVVVAFSDGTYRQSGTASPIQVFADPAAAPPDSFARDTLALVETAIQTLSTGTNLSVNINGQGFTKKNLKELYEFRDALRAEIAAEDAALGLQSGFEKQYLVVRFAPTS